MKSNVKKENLKPVTAAMHPMPRVAHIDNAFSTKYYLEYFFKEKK
jgi:hypothetical protein